VRRWLDSPLAAVGIKKWKKFYSGRFLPEHTVSEEKKKRKRCQHGGGGRGIREGRPIILGTKTSKRKKGGRKTTASPVGKRGGGVVERTISPLTHR